MFFPSAGFCLVIAFIVEFVIFKSPVADFKEVKDKKILLILTSISVLFAGITINRNRDWKDTYTLVSADSKRSAENSRLYYFAANEEMAQTKTEGIDPATKKQMFEESIMDYRKCLAIYPGFCDAQTNLANAFMFAMLLDSAEAHGKMAVTADPYNANALNTLANVYMANKEYSPAIKLLDRAIAIDDANTLLPFNIGICNMNIRNYDSAIYYFRKVINRDTENSRALQLMAIAFDASGKKDSAAEYERMARKYDPGFSVNNTSR
jgi:tetratricopeptide (TPR) repeat protein